MQFTIMTIMIILFHFFSTHHLNASIIFTWDIFINIFIEKTIKKTKN